MISFRLFGSAELRDEQGRSFDALLRRPKRLALLAYLALTSRDGFQRKDKLVAMFWPESDQARARQALRQALYVLRSELGPEAVVSRGDEEVALNLDIVRVDVAAFEAALKEGRDEEAVDLYRGELLDGFHLSGAGEFERWLEGERMARRRGVLIAARTQLEDEEAARNSASVVRWAQRLLDIVPSDEYSARKLILHRALLGDRAGAVREYETFAKRLMADFAVEPSSYALELVEKIRTGQGLESEPRSGARDLRSESALGHARLNWAEHLAAEDDLDAVESTAELEKQVEPQYTIQRENDASRQPKSAHVPRVSIEDIEASRNPFPVKRLLSDPGVLIPVGATLLLAAVATGSYLNRNRAVAWAYRDALPTIDRLVNAFELDSAFRLFRRVEQIIPGDPELEHRRPFATRVFSVSTDPPGVDVHVKGYLATEAEWVHLGRTPIEEAVAPPALLRWRLRKEGYQTLEAVQITGPPKFSFTLTAQGAGSDDMVFVPGGRASLYDIDAEVADFWIDRYEVTNDEFKAFIEAGGYDDVSLWTHAFMDGGGEIRRDSALRRFEDVTGRRAPATWEFGSPADGQEHHPVGGVSWYEAAAYCVSQGKTLPTIYHWMLASGATGPLGDQIARLGNIGDASGTALPVGSNAGISSFGSYDMAGNVREWVLNADADGSRYLLGGARSDPLYVFIHGDASSPWERIPENGFRCARYDETAAENATAAAPVSTPLYRDYSLEAPVSDEVFEAYRALYDNTDGNLDSRIEARVESPWYVDETISMRAAYGDERLVIHLFLPKNSAPPYQVVLYFPGLGAFIYDWTHPFTTWDTEFLMRSGRAVAYPFYKGTYTRKDARLTASETRVRQFQDLRRSIDYLETRNDIDVNRLAFYGFSFGGMWGPIFTALEDRFRASILVSGGFGRGPEPPPPLIDPLSFVTRSTVPTLMIHGRYDAIRPVRTHTEPMFRLLGTPDADKRLVLVDVGHILPMNPVIRESLDWLDRYLGPVTPAVRESGS